MYSDFVHLSTHTSYSLSEGAIKVKDLVDLCIKHKMPAIAVTDTGNLFSSLEFSQACVGKGVQPIVGCSLLIDTQISKGASIPPLDRINLYAKDDIGYKNLLKLVSMSYTKQYENLLCHIKFKDLQENNEGILVLTAGIEGTVGRLLLEKDKRQAERFLMRLKEVFGDRLYIELSRHGLKEQVSTEPSFISFAEKHYIPLVATNNVLFANEEMHEAHDVLLCIAGGRYVTEENRRKATREHYFKSPRTMKNLFADIPEAIENTLLIAKRCSVFSESREPMLPRVGKNEEEELKKQARQGLRERLKDIEGSKRVYEERLEYELNVIIDMKFPGYFLIVSDFIKWSIKKGIPVGPGRGSGAGSVVAWCLYITDLDPIKFGLIFERFLNPERVSMPDFDIDFCQDRRDEVIQYVRKKYGEDKVAQIITFGKLQARAVIRDVGRVMQMPYGQVDKISKLVPFNPVNPVTLAQAIDMEPLLKNARKEDSQVDKLLSIALKLEGLHRHASTHAAGVVIADRSLVELVPLYSDLKSNMLVIQYSMKYAEMAGLVKFDFLGLKTLTVIADTVKLIEKTGSKIDIKEIDFCDRKTFKMLSSGNSTGVFQFESAGMRDSLRKLKPDSIEDLMALGALYRPGPMSNIPVYIACKHGKQEPDYLHPKLEETLKDTFGVIIYQEQVMKIAQVLAGYSMGGADLLRKAMGKKIKSEMDAQREKFVSGAVSQGVDRSQASSIFNLVAKFAGYGFNKSHAAAYAMISYQTAFLKANYPIEFLVASLNLDIGDTDKINIFLQEAKMSKIEILPPDINSSKALFSIEGEAIRYGLSSLKNVGEKAMDLLSLEREENGKFEDVFDLASRLDSKVLNKRQLENIIKSGGFDSFDKNRKKFFDSVEIITNHSALANKDKDSNQISLFGASSSQKQILPALAKTQDWNAEEKLKFEFESFGFYHSNHPLDAYKKYLKKVDIVDSAYLRDELIDGFSSVMIAGVMISTKARVSPRGRYITALVSDCTGTFEISIFDDKLLQSCADLINSNLPLCIYTEVRKDEGGIRLIAQSIKRLDDHLIESLKEIKIWLKDKGAIRTISDRSAKYREGKTRFYINVITEEGSNIEMLLPKTFSITPSESSALEGIEGVIKLELTS